MLLVLCIIDKKSTATPFCQFSQPEHHLGQTVACKTAKEENFHFCQKSHFRHTRQSTKTVKTYLSRMFQQNNLFSIHNISDKNVLTETLERLYIALAF
jgi:hypothetical protein